MNNIKISIITVSYNSQKTIEETFLSVLNQNYRIFEYIVVDGASQDDTLLIIKKYEKIFTKQNISFVYISEKDYGIYDAMNKGIKLAKGDWIGIINSDDFYCLNAFDLIVKEINKYPDSNLIYGNLNIIDNDSKFISQLKPNLKLDNIKHTMSIFHPTVFISKKTYDSYGLFNLNYKLSADWDLLKRFFLENVKFQYIDFPIANFRKGGAGSGFKTIHLFERFKIRHNKSFEILFIWYDIKDILILLYYKIFPNKPLF